MDGPIALIKEGRLDALGTADDLLRRPPTVFAATFFGAVNLYKADVAETAERTPRGGRAYCCRIGSRGRRDSSDDPSG